MQAACCIIQPLVYHNFRRLRAPEHDNLPLEKERRKQAGQALVLKSPAVGSSRYVAGGTGGNRVPINSSAKRNNKELTRRLFPLDQYRPCSCSKTSTSRA
eukprot:GHVO01070290.1.p2 GENE.GHVO01070290.1~~GHVO01070290.1.p2  ORF type:complete len:100 (-),score=7.83 GHVO01070290.1:173-472(-)